MREEDFKPMMPGRTWGEIVARHTERFPGRVALAYEDVALSYREVAASVDECAHRLAALGVKAGDCIAMLSPPRPEAMITLLAAARLGAVWVGLNPRYRIREMAYVIGHARPALIVSVKGFEERDYAADLDEAIAEVGD